MINWTYHFSADDLKYCMKVSKFRDTMQSNRHPNRKRSKEGILDSILSGFVGALGELAISKISGIRWDGAMLNDEQWLAWMENSADLGPFEVKTISYPTGKLILTDSDKDWAIGLLVLADKARDIGLLVYHGKLIKKRPTAKVLGQLHVTEAKNIGEKNVHMFSSGKFKITYVVPQNKLRPVSDVNNFLLKLKNKSKYKPVKIAGDCPPFYLT